MKVLELAKKLISIPSYVDKKTNENQIGEYIYGFLKQNFPWLKLEKQVVKGNRFNIIAKNRKNIKLLFVNHIDTVEPKLGGSFDPLTPKVKDGKLYGLGAVDRKGGIAALLSALTNFKKTTGLALLFYVDEEYDFKGMKKFVSKSPIKPNLIIGCESNFEIVNGCRSLIELTIQVIGNSGHSSRPTSGKNAIEGLLSAVDTLKTDIERYKDKTFGETTLNLAYLRGGTRKGLSDGEMLLSNEGNNIPDYAEAVIELRPSVVTVTAGYVVDVLKKNLYNNGYVIKDIEIRHDLKGYKTEKNKLIVLEETIKKSGYLPKYKNLKYGGYSDMSMLRKKLNCPCANFGPKGANKHKENEYVEIESLKQAESIYKNLIELCTQIT